MLSPTPSSTVIVPNFLNLPHGICTANPTNIQHLLQSNFSNYVKGSRFHDVLHELLGDGIFNVDGNLWTVQRKIASHDFNTKSLRNFISDTVESGISNRLLPYLSAASLAEKPTDLQDVLQRFTFSNVLKVAFGIEVDLNEKEVDNLQFVRAFDLAVEIASSRFTSPLPLTWQLKRFLRIGCEARFADAIKVIDIYAMEIIKSREKEQENEWLGRENRDLLSRFLSLNDIVSFDDGNHKRKFLRDIIICFILAGKDSTSTALTWFFWLISAHPRVAELIYTELMSVATAAAEEEKEKEKEVFVLRYDELKNLHYLHAALSESMRLFPPLPINSRLAVEDDVLPDGTHVKRGVFRPFDQFQYPVFHGGPRICLGKEMAYVQMKSVAASILHEYEIVALDGGGTAEKMMNPPYMLSLTLKMKGGFPVKLKRRRH
ncbi:Cytochrome P450 [Quillaja saponaria]|uniref:Cytochrome P450 n=1 Tax=Quillaja saponaria TaxID=32244 RepID=A0AAD7M549_QUISA|nr:Cytochrome P450 [Quillaja saponaria]